MEVLEVHPLFVVIVPGLDLTDPGDVFSAASGEMGRNSLKVKKLIQDYQESFSVIERCRVPVIAAVHGACVGGGE